MTVPIPITVEDLTMEHPIYTLRLTAAQRSILDWLTCKGALYAPRAVDVKVVEEMAEDCGISVSTVYEALNRLTNLLLVHREGVFYQVNPASSSLSTPRSPNSPWRHCRPPTSSPTNAPTSRVAHRRPRSGVGASYARSADTVHEDAAPGTASLPPLEGAPDHLRCDTGYGGVR